MRFNKSIAFLETSTESTSLASYHSNHEKQYEDLINNDGSYLCSLSETETIKLVNDRKEFLRIFVETIKFMYGRSVAYGKGVEIYDCSYEHGIPNAKMISLRGLLDFQILEADQKLRRMFGHMLED